MFHLIPSALHRLALRSAHWARKQWWRVRRPRLSGCRVIALDLTGQVLLVRHSYGSGRWMLPGGGIGRGETSLDAAARELAEETGCRIERARQVDAIEENLEGATNCVQVVVGQTLDEPVPDGREIIEARFFALDALPQPMARGLAAGLPGWIKAAATA